MVYIYELKNILNTRCIYMNQAEQPEKTLKTLIERKVEKILTPIESFIRSQAAASILLILATLIALVIANSSMPDLLQDIGEMKLGIYLNTKVLSLSINGWLSDGFLALFFFLIGLEIKREVLIGQFRHPRNTLLILVGAIGGMVVPATIYFLFNHDGIGRNGWAIPMATDTAFSIGVLALLATRVSISASIYLAALAIVDDIITILIIGIFYTHELDTDYLLKALIPFSLLFVINLIGIRRGWIYIILGVTLWWCIYQSGIHATLAGLLLAFAIPARSQISQQSFITKIRKQITDFELGKKIEQTILKSAGQHTLTESIKQTTMSASTPLQRWHAILANPIAIIIMPAFALFHAGINFSEQSITVLYSDIALGIILGLVVGKPLGIVAFSFIALKFNIVKMPKGMQFYELIGVSILAGIGFTMSLFITNLGFQKTPELIDIAKIAILTASMLSAFAGTIWFLLKKKI
jgi:NhaA family Na+:H+ antiporter